MTGPKSTGEVLETIQPLPGKTETTTDVLSHLGVDLTALLGSLTDAKKHHIPKFVKKNEYIDDNSLTTDDKINFIKQGKVDFIDKDQTQLARLEKYKLLATNLNKRSKTDTKPQNILGDEHLPVIPTMNLYSPLNNFLSGTRSISEGPIFTKTRGRKPKTKRNPIYEKILTTTHEKEEPAVTNSSELQIQETNNETNLVSNETEVELTANETGPLFRFAKSDNKSTKKNYKKLTHPRATTPLTTQRSASTFPLVSGNTEDEDLLLQSLGENSVKDDIPNMESKTSDDERKRKDSETFYLSNLKRDEIPRAFRAPSLTESTKYSFVYNNSDVTNLKSSSKSQDLVSTAGMHNLTETLPQIESSTSTLASALRSRQISDTTSYQTDFEIKSLYTTFSSLASKILDFLPTTRLLLPTVPLTRNIYTSNRTVLVTSNEMHRTKMILLKPTKVENHLLTRSRFNRQQSKKNFSTSKIVAQPSLISPSQARLSLSNIKITPTPYRTTPLISTLNPHLKTLTKISNTHTDSLKLGTALYSRFRGPSRKTTENFRPTDSHSVLLTKTVITKPTVTSKIIEKLTQSSSDEKLTSDQPVFNTNDDYLNKEPWAKLYNNKDWTSLPNAENNAVNEEDVKQARQIISSQKMDLVDKIIAYEKLKAQCKASFDIYENQHLDRQYKSRVSFPRGHVQSTEECIKACCRTSGCTVAYLRGKLCFSVTCHDEKSCKPIENTPNSEPSLLIYLSKNTNSEQLATKYPILTMKDPSLNPMWNPYTDSQDSDICRRYRVQKNKVLKDGWDAGEYRKFRYIKSIYQCEQKCCEWAECNVALIISHCFTLKCNSAESCLPVEPDISFFKPKLSFIRTPNSSWLLPLQHNSTTPNEMDISEYKEKKNFANNSHTPENKTIHSANTMQRLVQASSKTTAYPKKVHTSKELDVLSDLGNLKSSSYTQDFETVALQEIVPISTSLRADKTVPPTSGQDILKLLFGTSSTKNQQSTEGFMIEPYKLESKLPTKSSFTKASKTISSSFLVSQVLSFFNSEPTFNQNFSSEVLFLSSIKPSISDKDYYSSSSKSYWTTSDDIGIKTMSLTKTIYINEYPRMKPEETGSKNGTFFIANIGMDNNRYTTTETPTRNNLKTVRKEEMGETRERANKNYNNQQSRLTTPRKKFKSTNVQFSKTTATPSGERDLKLLEEMMKFNDGDRHEKNPKPNGIINQPLHQINILPYVPFVALSQNHLPKNKASQKSENRIQNQSIKSKLQPQNENLREGEKAGFGMLGSDGPIDQRGATLSSPLHHHIPQLSIVTDDDTYILPPDKIMSIDRPTSRPYTTSLDPKYRGTLNPKYLDKSYFPQKVYYPVYNTNSTSGTISPLITSKPQRTQAVTDDNQPIIIPEFDEIKGNTSEKHTFKGNASNDPTSKSIVTSLKILQELDNLSNGKIKQDKDKQESRISELQSTKTEVGETHNEIPAVSTTKNPFIFYVKRRSTTSISRASPFTTSKPATMKPVPSLNSTTSPFLHLTSLPVNVTYENDSFIFDHILTKETRVTDKNNTLCKNVRLFNASLRYGIKSGKFFDAGNVEDFDSCIKKCCQKVECNIAYMLKTRCYIVICSNLERCSPISSKSSYFQPRFAYVLKTKEFSEAVSYVMDQFNLTYYKSHKPTKMSSTGKSLKNTTSVAPMSEETKMGKVKIIKPNLKTTDQILPSINSDIYQFFNTKSVEKTILSRRNMLSTNSIRLKSNSDVKPSSSFYINKIDTSSASADLSAFFAVMSSHIANQNQSVVKNLQISKFEEKAAVRQSGSQNMESKTNDSIIKEPSDTNNVIHNGFKTTEDSNGSKLKLLLKTLIAVSNDLQTIQSKKDVDENKISNLFGPLFKNLNETQALLLQKVLKLQDKSKNSFDNASMHEIIASIIKNIRETNKEIYPSQVPSLSVTLTENKNNATSSLDMSTKVALQSTPSQKTWKTSKSPLQVVNLKEFVDKEIQRLEHGIIHPSTSFIKIVSNQGISSQPTEKLRWTTIPSTININSIASSSPSQILVPWTLTVSNSNRGKEHQGTVNFHKTPKQSTKISNDNRDGSINDEKMAHNFGGKPINSALLHDDIASSFVENIKPSDTDDPKEEDENMNHYEQELENEEKPDQSETNQDDDGLRESQELASNSADDQQEKEQQIPTSFPSKEQKPSKFTSTVLNTAEKIIENPTKLIRFSTSRTTNEKPHITESYPHEKIIKALLSDREAQQKLVEALNMEKEALRGKTVDPTDDDTSNQQKEQATIKEGAIQKSSATDDLTQEDVNLQKYHTEETSPSFDNPTAKQVEKTSSKNVNHEEDSHQNIDVPQDNRNIDNRFQEHQQTSTDTLKEQRLTEEKAEKLRKEEEIIKKEEEIQNKKAERRPAGLVMKMEKFVSEVQHVYKILKQRSLNSLSEEERKFQEAIHEEIKSWNISSTVKHMENQVLEFANHVSENREEDFVKPLLTQLTNIMVNLTNIEREKWSRPKPTQPIPQINDPYDLGTNIYKKQIVAKRKEHHRKSNEVMQKVYKLLRKKFDTLSKKVEAKFQFQTKTFQKVQKAIQKNWQDYRRLDQISNDLKKLESQKDINTNTYKQNTRNIVSVLMTTPTTTKKTKNTLTEKTLVTTNNKNTTSVTKTTARTRLGAPSTLATTTAPPIMNTTIITTRETTTEVTKTAAKPTLMTLLKNITVPKPSHSSFTEVQSLKESLIEEMNNAKTTNDQLCDHTSPVEGYTLSNNLTEGIFYQGLLPSFDICIDECCKRNQCDVAFMIKNYCLLVTCKTLDYCRLKRINEEKHQPQLVSVMMRYIARKEFLGISEINPTIKFAATKSASTFSSQHYPMETKKGSNFTYQQLGMKKSYIVHKPQSHYLKNLKHKDEIIDQLIKTNVPQVELINDVSAKELFDHKEYSNKNKNVKESLAQGVPINHSPATNLKPIETDFSVLRNKLISANENAPLQTTAKPDHFQLLNSHPSMSGPHGYIKLPHKLSNARTSTTSLPTTTHLPLCQISPVSYNVSLYHGKGSGYFFDQGIVKNAIHCGEKCCHFTGCDIAFMLKNRCFAVKCKSTDVCKLVPAEGVPFTSAAMFVTQYLTSQNESPDINNVANKNVRLAQEKSLQQLDGSIQNLNGLEQFKTPTTKNNLKLPFNPTPTSEPTLASHFPTKHSGKTTIIKQITQIIENMREKEQEDLEQALVKNMKNLNQNNKNLRLANSSAMHGKKSAMTGNGKSTMPTDSDINTIKKTVENLNTENQLNHMLNDLLEKYQKEAEVHKQKNNAYNLEETYTTPSTTLEPTKYFDQSSGKTLDFEKKEFRTNNKDQHNLENLKNAIELNEFIEQNIGRINDDINTAPTVKLKMTKAKSNNTRNGYSQQPSLHYHMKLLNDSNDNKIQTDNQNNDYKKDNHNRDNDSYAKHAVLHYHLKLLNGSETLPVVTSTIPPTLTNIAKSKFTTISSSRIKTLPTKIVTSRTKLPQTTAMITLLKNHNSNTRLKMQSNNHSTISPDSINFSIQPPLDYEIPDSINYMADPSFINISDDANLTNHIENNDFITAGSVQLNQLDDNITDPTLPNLENSGNLISEAPSPTKQLTNTTYNQAEISVPGLQTQDDNQNGVIGDIGFDTSNEGNFSQTLTQQEPTKSMTENPVLQVHEPTTNYIALPDVKDPDTEPEPDRNITQLTLLQHQQVKTSRPHFYTKTYVLNFPTTHITTVTATQHTRGTKPTQPAFRIPTKNSTNSTLKIKEDPVNKLKHKLENILEKKKGKHDNETEILEIVLESIKKKQYQHKNLNNSIEQKITYDSTPNSISLLPTMPQRVVTKSKTTRKDALKTASLTKTTTTTLQTIPPTTILPQTTKNTSSNIITATTTSIAATTKPLPTVEKTTKILTSPNINIIIQPATLSRETNTNPSITGELGVSSSPLQTADNKHTNLLMNLGKQQEQQREQSQHLLLELQEQLLLEQQKKQQERQETLQSQLLKQQQLQIQQDEQQTKQLLQEQMKLKQFREQLQKLAQEKQQENLLQKQLLEKQLQFPTQRPETKPIKIQHSSLTTGYTNSSYVGNTSKPKVSNNVVNETIDNILQVKLSSKFKNKYRKNNSSNNLVDELLRDGSIFKDKLKTGIYSNRLIDELLSDMTDNEKQKHEQQQQLDELEELQKLKQPLPLQVEEHHLQQLQQLEELQRKPKQNQKQLHNQQVQLQQQYQFLPFQPNQLQYPIQLQKIALQNPTLQLQVKELQQLGPQQYYQALQQQQQPEMQQQYMLLPMLNKQLQYLKNLQQLKLLNPEILQQNKQFVMQQQKQEQRPINPQLKISDVLIDDGKEVLKQVNPIQDLVNEDSDQSPLKISKTPLSTTQAMPTTGISGLQSEENVSKNNKDLLFLTNNVRNPWPYYNPKMKDVLLHLMYQGISKSNGKYQSTEKLVNEDETDEPKTVHGAEYFLNGSKSLKYLKQLENLNLENYRNLNSLRKELDITTNHYGNSPNWNQSYTEETDGTEQVSNNNDIVALGSTNANHGKIDRAHHAQSLTDNKGSDLNSSMYIFDYGNPTEARLSNHVEKYVTEDQDMDHENKIFRAVPLSSQLIYPQFMNFNKSNQNGNFFNVSKVYSTLNGKTQFSKKPKIIATSTPKPSHLEESPILDLSQENSSESVDTDHIDSDDPLAKTIFKITNKPKALNKTTIIENEPVIVLSVNSKQTERKENKLENIEKQQRLPEESPDITLATLHNLTAVNAYKKSSQQNKNTYVLDTTKKYDNLTKKTVNNSAIIYNTTIVSTGIRQQLASKINDKFDVNKTNKHNNHTLIKIKKFCFYGNTQYNVTLRGGLDAGIYVDNGNVNNSSECAKLCCEEESCDLAFMIVDRCFSVRCYDYSSCDTVKPKVKQYRTHVIFVKRNIKTKSKQTVSLLQSLYEPTEKTKITTKFLNLNQTRQQNHSKITYDGTFNGTQSTTSFKRTNAGKNLTTINKPQLLNTTSTDATSIKHSTNNQTEDSHNAIQKDKQPPTTKIIDEKATTRNMINYSSVNNIKENDSRSFLDLSESAAGLRADTCLNTVFENDLSFKNGFDAGIFIKRGKTQNSSDCIRFCCFEGTCDAAFMINDFCYSVKCHQGKCLTEKSKKPNFQVKVAFVNEVQELYKKSEILHHEQKDPISKLFKTDDNSTVNSPTESLNENNQIDYLTKEIFRLEQKLDNTTLNKRLSDIKSELYTTLKPTRSSYNTARQLLWNVNDDRVSKRAQFYAARGIKEGTAVDFGAAEADLDTWDKGRPSVGSQKHIELDGEQQHTIFGKNSYQDRPQIEPDFLDDSTKTYVNDDEETNRVSDETNSPTFNENIHAATKNNVNHYKDTNDDILQIDSSILHHEDNYDVNDVTNSRSYQLQTHPDSNHLEDELNSHHIEEGGNDVKDFVETKTGGTPYFFMKRKLYKNLDFFDLHIHNENLSNILILPSSVNFVKTECFQGSRVNRE